MLDCFFWKKFKNVFFCRGDFACFLGWLCMLLGWFLRFLCAREGYILGVRPPPGLFLKFVYIEQFQKQKQKLGPKFAIFGGQKCAKMGNITIFSKLKALGCWFLFPSPHFPTHWVHLKWFQTFPIIGWPKFWA